MRRCVYFSPITIAFAPFALRWPDCLGCPDSSRESSLRRISLHLATCMCIERSITSNLDRKQGRDNAPRNCLMNIDRELFFACLLRASTLFQIRLIIAVNLVHFHASFVNTTWEMDARPRGCLENRFKGPEESGDSNRLGLSSPFRSVFRWFRCRPLSGSMMEESPVIF